MSKPGGGSGPGAPIDASAFSTATGSDWNQIDMSSIFGNQQPNVYGPQMDSIPAGADVG